MRFGLNIVPVRAADLTRVGRRAEELGYDSLWYGEHVATPVRLQTPYPRNGGRPPFSPDSRFLEPFATLTHLAAVTSRVTLGTGVLVAPLHAPMHLARALTTLDVLSGGRAALGLGVGWMKDEFDIMDREFGNRGKRTDELLEVLDLLFTEARPRYAGRYYRFDEVGFEPKPVSRPRPPFLVGGESEASLRRAVLRGDGWFGSSAPVEQIAVCLRRIGELRAELGRTEQAFETTAITPFGQGFDAGLIDAYAALGIDRLVVTPWRRPAEAVDAVAEFAEQAGLTAV
ncbi:TIGR03619 family F420-dependent LLM class oxidoreductase [Nocardia abscessus]|jgi:probable F420-dependent oxidoreductase|uniref:TIGR03619 family F420-dependent LLM class oxidoreductase n=1 Tax=Nocardia TaxID=1817 RepID=UPI0018954032|nr:TIGR03619 family F420-dependent LLM class oxidoreductase [Nocardia abscessus]MBF6472440.1 TIGR03619 family F420-dependent LLM class oxidoreductase [Nocardia abscessus]